MPENVDTRFSWRDEFNFLTSSEYPSLTVGGTSFSFIVISDTHDSDFTPLNGEFITGDEFVIITGDITYGGTAELIDDFKTYALALSKPCYPVLGNHDIDADRGRPWKAAIGSTIYRVDIPGGDTTLFILDSADAIYGKDQLDWLERGLKTAHKNVFVFTHCNFFNNSPTQVEQFNDIRERARIMSLLHGRCRAVFSGHLHDRVIKEFGGVQYYTLEDFSTHKNYCRVTVSATGISYDLRTVP
jgi:predicted phosphodiesterase